MGCMRCVYRGGSREGGPDGVWCEEGVAFRCVWVLWGAYGDARLKLDVLSLPLPFLSPTSRHTSRPAFLAIARLSRSRPRSVYYDVKRLNGGMIRTGGISLKKWKVALSRARQRDDKSVWRARARVGIAFAEFWLNSSMLYPIGDPIWNH